MADDPEIEINVDDLVRVARNHTRAERDRELAANRPYPFIVIDEFAQRMRRGRWKIFAAALLPTLIMLPAIFVLAALGHKRIWVAFCIIPAILLWVAAFTWARSWIARRLGLCCPYCKNSLLDDWAERQMNWKNTHTFVDGRCRACQRLIIQMPGSTLDGTSTQLGEG